MCKSEIFAKIINAVSIETEVSEPLILSNSKAMEVVDARSILAKLLQESGFYPMQIARFMQKTPASIRFLLTNYENRKNANKIIDIYTLFRKRVYAFRKKVVPFLRKAYKLYFVHFCTFPSAFPTHVCTLPLRMGSVSVR